MSRQYPIPLSRIDEAKEIVERLNRDEITLAQAMDGLYYLAYGRQPDHETEALIQRVKSHGLPPYREDDPYYERQPWKKFGCISSDLGGVWRWYDTDVIINEYNLTTEDIVLAEQEIEESWIDKAENYKEAPCAISKESENSAADSQRRGSRYRTGGSGSSCAMFSGLWEKIRSFRKTTR